MNSSVSSVVDVSSQDTQQLSSVSTQNIAAKVQCFVDDRKRAKKRKFILAIKVGCILMLIFWFLRIGRLVVDLEIIRLTGDACYSLGLVTFTVCPLNELDLDDYIAKWPRIRTIVYSICLGSGLLSYARFPYTYLSVVVAPYLAIIFGGNQVHKRHYPRATSLHTWALLLNMFTSAISWQFFVPYYTYSERLILAIVFVVGSSLLAVRWFYLQYRYAFKPSKYKPTLWFYEVVYGEIVTGGILVIIRGLIALFSNHATNPFITIARGMVLGLPPLLVVVYGREKFFEFLVSRFERSHSQTDGKFIAELFSVDVEFIAGDTYWIDMETFEGCLEGLSDERTNEVLNHPALCTKGERSAWLEGTIQSEDDDTALTMEEVGKVYVVSVNAFPDIILEVEVNSRKLQSVEEILRSAATEIRCVDYANLTYSALRSFGNMNVRDAYARSRPLQKGESIDFFVSHSWRDDSAIKWRKLTEIAENFMLAQGRYPTFWMDKFCLAYDNGDPTPALRALGVYIMSCDQMLVFCGPTYSTRLWCAWELFVMLAFQDEKQALARLDLVPMGRVTDEESNALNKLANFDVTSATCFSPHDETRMQRLIDAVGRGEFNGKVRKLVRLYRRESYRMRYGRLPDRE